MIVLILYVLFFLVCSLIFKRIRYQRLLYMPFWIVVAYSFLVYSHIISPYHFQTKWVYILPYLFICLILLIGGYSVGIKAKTSKPYHFAFKNNSKKLFFVTLIGGVALAIDFFRLNQISFGMRVEDQNLSIIGVIGSALTHLSILIWLKALYEYEHNDKTITIWEYLSAIIYVVFSILSGGRQAILLLLISSMIVIIYGRKQLKLITPGINYKKLHRAIPLPIYIFVVLIAAYFGTVSMVRSQIADIDNKMDMFENSGQITLDEDFRNYARNFPAADVLVEAVYYYSHELPRLKLLFDYYDYPPTLGFQQFHYIERRFQWLWGDWVDKSWDHVEDAIEKKGKFSAHTWGTFVTNFIMDYGRLGTLFMCYFWGLLAGYISRRKEYMDTNYVISMVWLCSGAVFSIQFSPFGELCWFFPLVYIQFVKLQ